MVYVPNKSVTLVIEAVWKIVIAVFIYLLNPFCPRGDIGRLQLPSFSFSPGRCSLPLPAKSKYNGMFNPLSLNSDQHQISLYHISAL